jgi:hypothetical protein
MSNKLKAITTKAKALYKTGRFDKWTDAIKAASKTVSKTATKAAKKYGTKAKKYAIKKAKSGVKSLAKKVYESKYLAGTKKTPAKSYHKDTNSHNVKISVMSGDLKNHFYTEEFYIRTKKEIITRQAVIDDVKSRKKELVFKNGLRWYNNWIKDAQRTVAAQKKLLQKIKPFM